MSEEADKTAIKIAQDTGMPFIILVEGEKANDEYWMNNVYEDAVNPIIESIPTACALPGTGAQSRNLRFQLGTIGLKEKFSYYAFADQEMFEKVRGKLSEKGYQVAVTIPKPR